MKNLIIAAAFTAASFSITSCSNNSGTNTGSQTTTSETSTSPAAAEENKGNPSVKAILDNYLRLKDALANDSGDEAAKSGEALATSFTNFDKSSLTDEQKKKYEEIAESATEHAEHIGKNASNIAHQREHFDMLSKDVYDIVKEVGAGQTLYQAHCPMYNNNKGASWLTASKEINNPYMGKEMSTCGTIQEELN